VKEREVLEENHRLTLVKEKERHRDDMEELEVSHRHHMDTLREDLRKELLASIARAETQIREDVAKEQKEKVKKLIEEAWSDSGTMWEGKLKKEEEKLEKFKKDVAVQMQFMAEERSALLDRLSKSEEQMKQIDEIHKLERNNLRDDYEREKKDAYARFTKVLTHSPTHLLTLTHSLTYSLTHLTSLTHLLTHRKRKHLKVS
jgi:transcription initiation factor IIF auxiliary subunit